METSHVLSLLEQLDDNLDDLEDVAKPLLDGSVAELSKKLPVLDKAKLYVLVAYAIESLIFSYLRLRGVDAKQHPVYRELARVKQYFEKIKALETEPEERTMTLDKQAAGRFIKHGLAGNERFDLERKEQEAKSKARAQLKAAMLASKSTTEKPSSDGEDRSDDSNDSDPEDEDKMDVEPTPTAGSSEQTQAPLSGKKQKRKERREAMPAQRHKRWADGKERKERQESKKERRERKLEKRKAREAKQAG